MHDLQSLKYLLADPLEGKLAGLLSKDFPVGNCHLSIL